LRFDIQDLGDKEVTYTTTSWNNGQRETSSRTVKIRDKVCVAWAIEKETGERLESPKVTIEMAVKEGWYTKSGSKWQTMEEVMLRYRTASFFGKLYAPELLMGLQSVEEAQDIIEATTGPDGTISVNVDELRTTNQPGQRQQAPAQSDATDIEAREPASQPDTASETAQDGETAASASADTSTGQQAEPTGGDAEPGLDPAAVEHQIANAKSLDVLDLAGDSIEGVNDLDERARLHKLYQSRRVSMTAEQQRAPATTSRRRMAAPE
jgi:hypothetical protein